MKPLLTGSGYSSIQQQIYEIRNQRVMLDFDLAAIYQVETRTLKQAVRRNLDRFPDDFMFRLSKEEANRLIHIGVSQNVIPAGYNPGGAEIFAFSELGVAMLSSVLRSGTAIKMNISIMRAFVAVRQQLTTPPVDRYTELQADLTALKTYIEEVFTDYNDINEDTRIQLELINESLAELQADRKLTSTPRRPIGYTTR
ncbi:ORF6N domain-containing protein [Parabacteroides sp. PF5-6]|uniref:ORF6N domain-containing protein n=1 Tax=Parabacteroides sp. PF5-6 TaxID=1742403 RepID=UPI0024067530|nr:ORF6N domain-containing protein [Parabacteroides sp. PF5-6]MDF9830834.1 hypothetical protein [Parabacteroides sp. PF5-6]